MNTADIEWGPCTTAITTYNEDTGCWERAVITTGDHLGRYNVHDQDLLDAAERWATDTDARPGTLWRCEIWDDADENLLITGPTFEMPA